MKCSVAECERDARYKSARLCQKHYFRMRRRGTTEIRKPKPRHVTPNGYVRVHAPTHPLAEPNGYVFEHRKVSYDVRNGGISLCEACGLVEVVWSTCHVDHVDEDRKNNSPENLMVTCNGCNVMRGRKRPHYTHKGRTAISYGGVTQTASEWARDIRVHVSATTIKRRKLSGLSDELALFGPKVTHKRVEPARVRPKFQDGKRVRA